jgi:hypothetical protein
MPLEKTLNRVRNEIEQGQIETARNRLHELIHSYPHNMFIRKMLGDVNFQLGNIREAGRWWYLIKAKSPEMQNAIQAFEKSCGNNPVHIGRRIKFRGCISEVRNSNEFAADRLFELHQAALQQQNYRLFCVQAVASINNGCTPIDKLLSVINQIFQSGK